MSSSVQYISIPTRNRRTICKRVFRDCKVILSSSSWLCPLDTAVASTSLDAHAVLLVGQLSCGCERTYSQHLKTNKQRNVLAC